MTVQHNLKNPEGLKKGEMLIFDGKKFDVITKEQIVVETRREFEKLKQEVELLRSQVLSIRDQVRKKQKRFLKSFIREVK